jgi:hypothetical protein
LLQTEIVLDPFAGSSTTLMAPGFAGWSNVVRLPAWCRHRGYVPAAHHRLLIDRLERVDRGEIKRLAVFLPPGSAKSIYGSVLFRLTFWRSSQDALLLASSHTTQLAGKWGRRVRNLISQHGATLGLRLATEVGISTVACKWIPIKWVW